jgi:hypothetical protein
VLKYWCFTRKESTEWTGFVSPFVETEVEGVMANPRTLHTEKHPEFHIYRVVKISDPPMAEGEIYRFHDLFFVGSWESRAAAFSLLMRVICEEVNGL